MTLQAGTRFGRYRIDALLGIGGMGAVYRGYDPRLQRPIAVKVIATVEDDLARGRLVAEARSAAALSHPGICTVYEIGEEAGQSFIAMEYIAGRSLRDVIGGRGLPVEEAVHYARQVADALGHAHDRGVIHRDLTSANVLVGTDGRVKVVDFGLARRVALADATTRSEIAATAAGALVGTIRSMAPEQLRGEPADCRSDIWALGVLLYELFTGAPPFMGHTIYDISTAVLRDPPSPLPAEVPAGLRRIVLKCLAKIPGQRYQRAGEVRSALEMIQSEPTVSPRGTTVPRRTGAQEVDGSFPVTSPALFTRFVALDAAPERTGFIGRSEELAIFGQLWDRAQAGRRQIVLLAGEPGVGKTSLALEVSRNLSTAGAMVLVGRCDEAKLVPYQPFVEALGQYVDSSSDAELRSHLAESVAELTRLVPQAARRVPDLPPPVVVDPEGQRYRLFEVVSTLLASASGVRPMVLVIDDVHWADKPTLLLIRYLARSRLEARLLIVGTYRDTELPRTHPLAEILADLRREPAVTRLHLRGLPQPEVQQLVHAWANRQVSSTFTTFLLDETAGNPFFIREILRHLVETGELEALATERKDNAGLGIPESVKEVIGQRLSRLSEDCNRILSLASVVGREFSLPLLAAVSDLDEERVLEALETAARAGVVAEVPTRAGLFGFTHALMRETLYDELSPSRRVRLHRRLGEALEELSRTTPVPLADVAHHFLQAAPGGDVDKAIGYSIKAAEQAAAGVAHEEAARFYELALHALDLKAPGPAVRELRADLRARSGRAFAHVGLWKQARRDLEAALNELDPARTEQRAELLVDLVAACFWLFDIQSMRRYAGESVSLAQQIGRNDLAAEGIMWLANALSADGDTRAAIEMDDRALASGAIAAGAARPSSMSAFAGRTLRLYLAGRHAEAVQVGRESAELLRGSGEMALRVYALPHLGAALVGTGRYSEAEQVFQEAREVGTKYGLRSFLARAIAFSAGGHLAVLDFAGAEALQEEAREMARAENFAPTVVSAGIDLMFTLIRRGEIGRAESLLPGVSAGARDTGGWHAWLWQLRLTQVQAELALARRRWEAAVRHSDEAIRRSEASLRVKYEVLGIISRSQALAGLGRALDAQVTLQRAVERARPVGDPALLLRAVVPLLSLAGNDALAREAREIAERILVALPNDAMRQRFRAAQEMRDVFRFCRPAPEN